MAAVAPARAYMFENNVSFYKLWALARPLSDVHWLEQNGTSSSFTLQRGSTVKVLASAPQADESIVIIKDIRRTIDDSPMVFMLGRELVTRDRLDALVMTDDHTTAVAASIASNELVDIGREVVFTRASIASVVRSELTEFDCQTLSLRVVSTVQPFFRRSISFKPVRDVGGTVRYTLQTLLSPICHHRCKLGRAAYSPGSQCMHWCAQCSTWMHRDCMVPALPDGRPSSVDPFSPDFLEQMWDALEIAPIIRNPRPELPPQSLELLIRDIRASGSRPTDVKRWMSQRGHIMPDMVLGGWEYFVCPRCKSVI